MSEPAGAAIPRPDPNDFPELDGPRAALCAKFGKWDQIYFPAHLGLELEEVRDGFARMRLPYRPEYDQPAGVMHGGAIATLIDTVVVPAIGSHYDSIPMMLTLSLNISFLGAIRGQDAVAEGWITRRGRSTVFCEAIVWADDGTPAARGTMVYNVRV